MWLDTEWDFDVALGAGFACDFINGLIDALAVVAPEYCELVAFQRVSLEDSTDAGVDVCSKAVRID